MTRGDLAAVVLPGAHGKPRPALIVQSELYAGHASVTLLPLTSLDLSIPLLRVRIEAGPTSGLRQNSFVMIDKTSTVPREKVGAIFGRIGPGELHAVDQALLLLLGLLPSGG